MKKCNFLLMLLVVSLCASSVYASDADVDAEEAPQHETQFGKTLATFPFIGSWLQRGYNSPVTQDGIKPAVIAAAGTAAVCSATPLAPVSLQVGIGIGVLAGMGFYRFSSMQRDVRDTRKDVKEIKKDVRDMKAGQVRIEGKVDSLQTDTTQLKEDTTVIRATQTQHGEQLSNIAATQDAHSDEFTALKTQVAALEKRVQGGFAAQQHSSAQMNKKLDTLICMGGAVVSQRMALPAPGRKSSHADAMTHVVHGAQVVQKAPFRSPFPVPSYVGQFYPCMRAH